MESCKNCFWSSNEMNLPNDLVHCKFHHVNLDENNFCQEFLNEVEE